MFFLLAAVVTSSQLSFPIHRMVQLNRKSAPYGSQANSGELRLASIASILNLSKDARIQADHYTALAMLDELTVMTIATLVDTMEVGGFVIIIPQTV